jgi:hypothetical protein
MRLPAHSAKMRLFVKWYSSNLARLYTISARYDGKIKGRANLTLPSHFWNII